MTLPILLASSSVYRQALLKRLQLPFRTQSPNIDETPYPNEAPKTLVTRLAHTKAFAIDSANTYIIASDQIAILGTKILGKPHTFERARAQLRACSGQSVTFYTALALRYNQQIHTIIEPYQVDFKPLNDTLIEQYLKKEQPLDCAGSFKVEGLGILLFQALHGRDPNSLIGLPLIALNELFQMYDICLLTQT